MKKIAEVSKKRFGGPDISKWTDSRLVRESLDGNQDAWSALIHKYKNLIFSVPIKYGFSRIDASDVFQSVSVGLLSELPKLREPGALPKWILMATSHDCFHRKYKSQKSQIKAHEISRWFQKDMSAEGGEIAQKAEREQSLRKAISDLPPQCRKFIHALFFEENARPCEEIAKELRLSMDPIGSGHWRCLGRLRRMAGETNNL